MHLMHPVVFSDLQFGIYIKALHGIGKHWKKWLNVLFLQLNFRPEKIYYHLQENVFYLNNSLSKYWVSEQIENLS